MAAVATVQQYLRRRWIRRRKRFSICNITNWPGAGDRGQGFRGRISGYLVTTVRCVGGGRHDTVKNSFEKFVLFVFYSWKDENHRGRQVGVLEERLWPPQKSHPSRYPPPCAYYRDASVNCRVTRIFPNFIYENREITVKFKRMII